jgi:hypothetical protein
MLCQEKSGNPVDEPPHQRIGLIMEQTFSISVLDLKKDQHLPSTSFVTIARPSRETFLHL